MVAYIVVGSFIFIALIAIIRGIWFKIKSETIEEIFEPINKELIFNVEKFNEWFCDPDNKATYAHRGIFGRTDKLSYDHIHEYLYHIWKVPKKHNDIEERDILRFYEEITKNWRNN